MTLELKQPRARTPLSSATNPPSARALHTLRRSGLRAPRLGSLVLALLLAGTGACSRSGPGAASPDATVAAVQPVEVKDDEFARTVHQFLLDAERGNKDRNLLAGLVQKQLERAGQRFARGQIRAGDSALTGAFLLLQSGQIAPGMFEGSAGPLLRGADEAARVGNAGRARALYRQLESVLPDGRQRNDVREHLAALDRWFEPSANSTPLQQAGRRQRASVQEALLEASPTALRAADQDVVAWVRAAFDSEVAERAPASPIDRDEALEAFRAVRTSGVVLAALHLRHGDPDGALRVFEEADLMRIVPPALRDRLERAAQGERNAWVDLFRLYDSAQRGGSQETSIDPELATGAAWGAALGLYRSSPGEAEAVMPLGMLLVDLGMAEVSSLVLAQNIDRKATSEALGWALALVLRALVQEEEVGSIDAARRTFANARPLLELAADPRFEQVQPRPGRIEYVMGALEARGGHLDRALPLIQAAVRSFPSVPALVSLANIERQRGNSDEAVRALQAAVQVAQANADPVAEAEAEELIYQIERDRGNAQAAAPALRRALDRALSARQQQIPTENLARVERLLARILEHYGEPLAARQAGERALEASRANARQIAASLTDMSRRALTWGDLRAAQRATREAVAAQLPADDLVYIALWQRLLERQLGARSDGGPEEALASLSDASGWVENLRRWGRGQVDDQGLLEMAQTPVERTEALFYVAMAQRTQQARRAGEEQLRQVAGSPAVDLVEVTIARDLLAPSAPARLALPSDVTLP